MKTFYKIAVVFSFFSYSSFAQSNYKSDLVKVQKKCTVNPSLVKNDYNSYIKNLEAPSPSGNSAKAHLLRQKIKSRKQFPVQSSTSIQQKNTVSEPKLGKEFGLTWYTKTNKKRIIYGGTPNDNTLAVSNDGILLASLNSSIYAYDLNTDTTAFTNGQLSLKAMAGETSSVGSHFFDPKLIYDEKEDKFILVFLKNTTPATNKIIVCFSTSSNPNDPWNVYELPGNPLDNNRWTDFPAISLSGNDLFITGNLIVPDVSWQVGFDGSVIWQIDKSSGYENKSELNTKLFKDITYDGKYIRNLHAVRGADGIADKQYFLSNRNFDIENDTIFVLDVEGNLAETDPQLSVNFSISNLKYGVPPNGRQADTDTSDPTNGLQTNDARVLAAIKLNNTIQFVSNSINPATGLSSIYHGKINDLDNLNITANRITHPTLDFGYPNIAWTGNENCDDEMIIAFNHTSPVEFPGISCLYVNNDGAYSSITTLKKGENIVDKLSGGYERWGDYFGLQRKYNEPGKVFSFGYFADESKRNTGWVNEIISPDTSKINISVDYESLSALCNQTAEINVSGGIPPYAFQWSNDAENFTNISTPLCKGDSAIVDVLDSRGCHLQRTIFAQDIPEGTPSGVFPNPFQSDLIVVFELLEKTKVTANIYDLNGRVISELVHQTAKPGTNELVFSTVPLSTGVYVVKVFAAGKEIVSKKVVKN
ncbi:MAG: T9SS type A sorting domain-containing protein [Flavobacteriales bacterium]